MPVILAAEDRERWLTEPDPAELMRPYPADLMTMWPVSQEVNSVKNDRPELLERFPEELEPASGEVERLNEVEPPCEPANSE
jgi:putative SOS response-associated peptidase YedK